MSIEIKKELTLEEFKDEVFEQVMGDFWDSLCSMYLGDATCTVLGDEECDEWCPEIPEYFDESQRKEIEEFKEGFGWVDFETAVRWNNGYYDRFEMQVDMYKQQMHKQMVVYKQQMHKEQENQIRRHLEATG